MMGFDRRLVEHFDWILFCLTVGVLCLGLLGLYSATYEESSPASPRFIRQLVWVAVGLCGMGIAFAIDYRRLEQWAYLLYGVALCLLISVPLIGSSGGGCAPLDQCWYVFSPAG